MQTINLNQNSFRLFPTIYMVQNDTGRELKMILDDVTLAGTETGAVAIKRSDGSYYTIPATLVTGENAFTANMSQALTQPSMTECQLKITDGNDLVVSSYTFHIKVQPSTDGISEEQLGYSVQDLMDAAQTILAGGMPAELQAALLQIAQKVAYIDDQGAQYYQDLYDALQPTVTLLSISAVYTQSGTVYTSDSLDSLKSDLVVTAHYSDGTSETVLSSMYSLSGTLTVGTSTITVSYDGQTTTFNVTVTATREDLFGAFTNGYSLGKLMTSQNYPQYAPYAIRTSASARATTQVPCANANYTFTVTDSSKYSINVLDVSSLTQLSVPNDSTAVDHIGYSCGSKTVSWNTTDSVSTDYCWIALKKNDNTAFTAEELADGAAAVFNYS